MSIETEHHREALVVIPSLVFCTFSCEQCEDAEPQGFAISMHWLFWGVNFIFEDSE